MTTTDDNRKHGFFHLILQLLFLNKRTNRELAISPPSSHAHDYLRANGAHHFLASTCCASNIGEHLLGEGVAHRIVPFGWRIRKCLAFNRSLVKGKGHKRSVVCYDCRLDHG